MSDKFTYHEYVTDSTFLQDYNAYQAKYAKQMRESDRVLLGLVRDALAVRSPSSPPARLLDIGCSTGNLLLHLRRVLPDLHLTGGDLAESSLAACGGNPDLSGVIFRRLDLLDLPADHDFDIVTVNAVLYMLTDEQFAAALRSLNGSMKAGGVLLVFDFFHPFEQDLSIIEKSRTHSEGLRLRFRPMAAVTAALESAGFHGATFRPFTLPIDLPRSEDPGDLVSFTVAAQDGRRLPFRGTLFQPWCHLTAVRAD